MKDAPLHFVSRAHEAAIDAKCWPSALHALGELLGGTAVALRLQFSQSNRAKILGAARFHDRHVTRHGAVLGDQRLNPFVEKVITSPLGMPILRESFLSDERYLQSDLYRQFYAPQKLFHASEIAVARWDHSVAVLNLARPRERRQCARQDFECLETVLPHLRHALQMSRRVEDLQAERDLSYETLDHLEVAILAVNASGRPLFLNQAAERLIKRNEGLSLGRGGLCGQSSRETLKLRQLIQHVASNKADNGFATLEALPLDSPARERPLSVLAVKGRGAARATGEMDRSADNDTPVLLFVCDPGRMSTCPIDTLISLYGLTPAEARLASAMAAGKTLDSAAQDFGIKKGTARIELSHIYSKTATHRQAELVRLLLSTALVSGD